MSKPLSPEEALIIAIANVARASVPGTWSEFLTAFNQFTDHQAHQCIQSPPGDPLHIAQGRAQNCAQLNKLMKESVFRADKIQENRK